MGELLLHGVSYRRILGDRLVRTRPSDPALAAAQSEAISAAERGNVVHAPEAPGTDLPGAPIRIGICACLRREFSGEPDAGNLHLRFDEGRVGRAYRVTLSPTLPVQCFRRSEEHTSELQSQSNLVCRLL